MAKQYFEKLNRLVQALELEKKVGTEFEVKHFFSGAALYYNDTICVSWSPAGLAFKLPESEAADLLTEGQVKLLKYFDKGNVKKGYAVFENPELLPAATWKRYFLSAIKQSL